MKKPKALVLLSGGLDSRLAYKILEEQLGKENVESVFFLIPFGGGCCNDKFCVFRFSQTQSSKLHIIDCTKGVMFKKYMKIIKNPKFQRGTAMNPCIDCHIFMLKEAKKLAEKIGAKIIATGEVVGERPLSQNRKALDIVEKESGLQEELLRPLSAKLLPETKAEKRKWIDRNKLHAIQGRQRKVQITLAKKYKISFPSPGGGCLLTDRKFSKKFKNLLEYDIELKPTYIDLIKHGRHFTYDKNTIIVGRNHKENQELLKIAKKQRMPYLESKDYMGPVTVIFSPKRISELAIKKAAMLTVRYSDAPKDKEVEVLYRMGIEKKTIKSRALKNTEELRL